VNRFIFLHRLVSVSTENKPHAQLHICCLFHIQERNRVLTAKLSVSLLSSLGLPLTSSFFTRVLVNTGSTLIQDANDEERVVGQRIPGNRRVRALNKRPLYNTCIYSDLFLGSQVPSFHKFQQFLKCLQKTAT